MSTGDLVNNVRKLKVKLKAIKYLEEINVDELREGNPTVYLPIYHHAFTSFSPAFSEHVLGMGIEMFGKSDARFMEAVYKVLRDLFSYKPPISKDQFFGKGYAERKMIMCTEILQFVISKNKSLNPAPSKTALKTSVRPRSAVDTKSHATNASASQKPKRPSSGVYRPGVEENSMPAAPQVVNELTADEHAAPVRHTSPRISPGSRGNVTRHIAGSAGTSIQHLSDNYSTISDASTNQTQLPKHVTIKTPPSSNRPHPSAFVHQSFDQGDNMDLCQEGVKPNYAAINTPSISRACQNAVEVVRIPKGPVMADLSILDIQAPGSDSILQSPAPRGHSTPDVSHQMHNLHKSVETLAEQMLQFDAILTEVKTSQSGGAAADPYIQRLETRIQGQLEELRARLVLVENRVSMIEVKLEKVAQPTRMSPDTNGSMSSQKAPVNHYPIGSTHPPITVLPQPQAESQPVQTSFMKDVNSAIAKAKFHSLQKESSVDFSLNYSPIRKANNGVNGEVLSANEDTFALEMDDDARRSSTPTAQMMDSLCYNFDDTQTNDAVHRMREMMLQTKAMLQGSTPLTATTVTTTDPPQ